MKNEKDQKEEGSSKKRHQQSGDQLHNKSDVPTGLEGGRGANKNDDPSEDSKGGGNRGLGNQKGANQGTHQGRKH